MNDSIITVRGKKERLEAFSHLLEDTTLVLKDKAQHNADYFRNNSGELLEDVVLESMQYFADKYTFDKKNFRKAKKQHFPDIITGDFFGVEVKSTIKNSWQSIGSSIVESLREEDVEKVFLMFGKLSPNNVDFRCKPYEDCLYDISVTHSPRYQIDMDIDADQTIFSKMGVKYDAFREMSNQIEIVRDYYRNKYKKENLNQMPWWIGDEKESSHLPKSLESNMGFLRLSKDLDVESLNYLKACTFILFPEVLGNNRLTKYNRAALWWCKRHSVINPRFRDGFTASGQISIYVDGKLRWERCPHIIGTFLEVSEIIRNVFPELTEDIMYYSDYFTNNEFLFESWKRTADAFLKDSIPEGLNINISSLLMLEYKNCSGSDYYTFNRSV